MAQHFNPLTNRQKNICEYGGIFGVLLSLTCLVQHIAVAIPGNITNPMIPGYLFAIAAFTLLGLQKSWSLILIIISAANAAFTEFQWIMHYSFSLVVLMLFIYHVIIIVGVYTEQIPEALKRKQQMKKEEEDEWKGKI
ncbi:MAG TPA: hypothetical protein VN451_04165 [Chitinophagaceae bacterium]|nr:hypothetical protein [Chitinophagaceae bacterium]